MKISVKLLLLISFFASCLSKNATQLDSKLASARCGYFETFEFINDTLAYRGYISDSANIFDTLKICKVTSFRNHPYIIYQLKTGEFYFLGYKPQKDGPAKIASVEMLAYACPNKECAKRTIKSKKASDSLLFYADFFKIKEYNELNAYSKLKNLNSMNIGEFNLLLDTMIEFKKHLIKSVSSKTLDRIDVMTSHYIVGQSLLKNGYSPFNQYYLFKILLNNYSNSEITKQKYEQFKNL